MTHWKKNFDYKFTGAYELQPGEEKTVIIDRTTHEDVKSQDGKTQNCFVAYFKGDLKPMVLNKTNCKTISKLYGPFIENWIGKAITIKAENVKAFGEMVEALRIKNVMPVIAQVDYTQQISDLRKCTTLIELQKVYTGLSRDAQSFCVNVKDEMKTKLFPKQ
jgi:hypothetical protein